MKFRTLTPNNDALDLPLFFCFCLYTQIIYFSFTAVVLNTLDLQSY